MVTTQQVGFQFKMSFSPYLILEVLDDQLHGMASHLAAAVNRAPHIFKGSPVIIDVEKLKSLDAFNIENLKQWLITEGMVPIGWRGKHPESLISSLPWLSMGQAAAKENIHQKPQEKSKTKLVTHPVRSGMQVHAEEGDLVVTAQVSSGAELIAAGYIHVYGALRGRALAGVHGDREARIFCRELDADLVAIAGYYLTKEEMPAKGKESSMMQIYLKDEQLQIEAL